MTTTSRFLILFTTLLLFCREWPAQTPGQPKILTRAEATEYKETSSYRDVMDFVSSLQRSSLSLRTEVLLQTAEGKKVPLLIVADPLPAGPSASRPDTRPVIFLQGNIHAGEVEGKEALLMLLREMLLGSRRDLLKKGIFLIAPIFNADGNDRISPQNRSYMPNPEKGVGIRANSENYDLNRDYLKTESREVRAVLSHVINRWDPLFHVDLHTTDGSFHQETVTFFSPTHPNCNASIRRFLWDRFYPDLQKRLAARGILSIPFGDFKDDLKPELGWYPYQPSPRLGVDYIGYRNRFSVLLEMYAYAPYRTRVEHCLAFLEELLGIALQHTESLKDMARSADREAAGWALLPASARPSLVLQTEFKPYGAPIDIEGYELEKLKDENGRTRLRPLLDRKRHLKVPFYADHTVIRSRTLPYGYLLKPGCEAVVRQLLRHGIRVDRLDQDYEGKVQQFHPASLELSQWVSEGHTTLQMTGEWKDTISQMESGFFLVPLNQPLCLLAALLLEPDHPDSLLSWNFFNPWVTRQWSRSLPALPLFRLMEPVPLVTHTLLPSDLSQD